jgi:hypothetical protein
MRGFLICLITARTRCNDRFSPTALESGAALAEASCRFVISRSRTRNGYGGQRRFLLLKAGRGGGRNARATSRTRARFWKFSPRQFTFENHRLPLALPRSSGKLRNSHVSLNPLSSRLLRWAIKNHASLVKNLWTMRLPCGRPRKTKNCICGKGVFAGARREADR